MGVPSVPARSHLSRSYVVAVAENHKITMQLGLDTRLVREELSAPVELRRISRQSLRSMFAKIAQSLSFHQVLHLQIVAWLASVGTLTMR